jgi:hypothetical protein
MATGPNFQTLIDKGLLRPETADTLPPVFLAALEELDSTEVGVFCKVMNALKDKATFYIPPITN